MKKLFTALLLLVGLVSFSQSIGYFRYDSIRFEKIGGNAELILLNGTRNVTGGVLTNLGNGRTAFVTPSGGGGSGGLAGGNLGSFHRLYYPPSQGIKTITTNYGVLFDSATANTFKISVDSTAVQPKNILYPNSVEKNGVTVRLVNDQTTPTDTTTYGYIGTKGWKAAALVNTGGGTVGQVVTWQGGKLFGLTSVSGGSSPPFRVQFRPGDTPNAPAAGDSIVVCDTFTSGGIHLYRDGDRQFYGDNSYGYTVSNDTIYVHPPFYASERVVLDIFDAAIDSASICAPAAPPAGWTYIDYPTAPNLTESPAHVWNAINANWLNFGLSATALTADGGYKMQYNSSSDNGQMLGWDAVNSNTDYTTWDYGFYLAGAGLIYRNNNGTLTSTGISITNGQWAALFRVSGTITIQTSADGLTGWTTIYTYSPTNSSTLYQKINVFQSRSAYYPQYQ